MTDPIPDDIVEAVARAIYSDSYTQYGTCLPDHWNRTGEGQRTFCRGQARAAIRAYLDHMRQRQAG